MNFRFKEKFLLRNYVISIVQALQEYPMNVLCAERIFTKWRPDIINEIMEYLKPENIRVQVVGKAYESIVNETVRPVTERPPHQIMEGDTNGEATARDDDQSEAGDSGLIEEISPKPKQGTQTTTFVFPANLAIQLITGELLQIPMQNVGKMQTFTFATTPLGGTPFRPILPKLTRTVKDKGGITIELAKPSTSTQSSESPSGATKTRSAGKEAKGKPMDAGKRPRDFSSSSSDEEKENRAQDPDFPPPRERVRKPKKTEKRKRM